MSEAVDPQVTGEIAEVRAAVRRARAEGLSIGCVPTMGALHAGHLSLIDECRRRSRYVVVTIFVNPTQFGPQEDFKKYPRDLKKDEGLAKERGVDCIFIPSQGEIYPEGDQTFVVVTEWTRGLCGPFRPGHFRGVTTVVAKLFLIVQPHAAVFGEKDFQQLLVIQRMVQDLHFPVGIISVPTVREPDGLAMSSRNIYLKGEQREEALNLYVSLQEAQEQVKKGDRDVKKILTEVRRKIASGPHTDLEYAEIVRPENLQPLEGITGPARLLVAARVHGVRLIDNIALAL